VACGESDAQPNLSALMIAMDSRGWVGLPLWETDGTNPDTPYGRESDMFFVADRMDSSFAVSANGDVARADRYAPLCLPKIAAQHRQRALEHLDFILNGDLFTNGSIEPGTRFLLLAPCPADSAPMGDRLAPILMFGEDVKPGLLTSGST